MYVQIKGKTCAYYLSPPPFLLPVCQWWILWEHSLQLCDEMCIEFLTDPFVGWSLCIGGDGETIGYYKGASRREIRC